MVADVPDRLSEPLFWTGRDQFAKNGAQMGESLSVFGLELKAVSVPWHAAQWIWFPYWKGVTEQVQVGLVHGVLASFEPFSKGMPGPHLQDQRSGVADDAMPCCGQQRRQTVVEFLQHVLKVRPVYSALEHPAVGSGRFGQQVPMQCRGQALSEGRFAGVFCAGEHHDGHPV